MPCCGKSTARSTFMGQVGSPRFGQTGVIELAMLADCDHPDCITPYNGKHRLDLAYLVGWNTEHERLFKSNEGKKAAAWASHLGGGALLLRNDRVMLTELPKRAVEMLYAE